MEIVMKKCQMKEKCESGKEKCKHKQEQRKEMI